MAGRRAAAGVVVAAAGLTVAGCGFGKRTVTASHTVTVTTTRTVTTTGSATSAAPCTGAQLSGTFNLVPGSAGAGQIEYALTVKNGGAPCSLHGVPAATLLGASGAALPTHVQPAGGGVARRVVLQHGASAVADARFSPSVPGQGDSQSGTCQPTAHTLQVAPTGGGVMDAAIVPPTSVCEQGTLQFEAFDYTS
jgi:Protein of unknown function (DUF4232)